MKSNQQNERSTESVPWKHWGKVNTGKFSFVVSDTREWQSVKQKTVHGQGREKKEFLEIKNGIVMLKSSGLGSGNGLKYKMETTQDLRELVVWKIEQRIYSKIQSERIRMRIMKQN